MKKILYLMLAVVMMFTSFAVGCGIPDDDEIDESKTQVYVSVFNGGFGIDWIKEAAKRFNEKNPEAQVVINPNKDIYQNTIAPAIESGISTSDVFVSAQVYCQDLGIKGYLEDLSDIWTADVDGNGTTVEQKMMDVDLFKKVYQTEGGIWGLPHSSSLQGFVYDHGKFVEKGWLMTEADGITLTKGKDGKAGTYDDGQPETEEEWWTMIQKIVGDTVYPFMWTGMYDTDYLESLQEALLAQYIGVDSHAVTFSYDGEIKHIDGTKETITPETGYKAIQMPEKKLVMDFYSKCFFDNSNYYHPSAILKSTSHTDAQSLYVLGYKGVETNPESAMLWEGVWWENEARATFTALENQGETDYKYGTRDYRYMLLPNFEGQLGGNGDGTGSVLGLGESGSIFIKKLSDETKRTYAKEFVKYLVSDEVSRLFTVYATGLRPYNYELQESDFENMTQFAKNTFELYSDTENVKIVRVDAQKYLSEMNYLTTPTATRWGSKVGGQTYTNAFAGVKNAGVNDYFAGMGEFANDTYWKPIYDNYLTIKK